MHKSQKASCTQIDTTHRGQTNLHQRVSRINSFSIEASPCKLQPTFAIRQISSCESVANDLIAVSQFSVSESAVMLFLFKETSSCKTLPNVTISQTSSFKSVVNDTIAVSQFFSRQLAKSPVGSQLRTAVMNLFFIEFSSRKCRQNFVISQSSISELVTTISHHRGRSANESVVINLLQLRTCRHILASLDH